LEEIAMRLDKSFVRHWSDRYLAEELSPLERELLSTTHAAIFERGYLTAGDLEKIGTWKTQRALGYLSQNSEDAIEEVTRLAFGSKTPEWMRHHILRILHGVGHPMASAILTIWEPENHTVLDYRAVEALQELKKLGALDLEPPPGQRGALPGYWTYLQAYRPIARNVGICFRDLDRALWKWHKEKMPDNYSTQ
jgi:hypothetical protein